MKRDGRLSKKQLAVIGDLFEGALDEPAIIKKHNLGAGTICKWFGDERFVAQLNHKIETALLQSRLIIARCGSVAAVKLVELTESDKPETARRACLDIISLQAKQSAAPAEPADKDRPGDAGEQQNCQQLEPELAAKILKTLAENENP